MLTKSQPPALETSKTDLKVNESKFDGVVINDEIEGVCEERTVACLPTVSGEQGSHGRWSASTVCMRSCGGCNLNTVASGRMHMFPMMVNCNAVGGRRIRTKVEGGRRISIHKIPKWPPPCWLNLSAVGAVGAGGWSCIWSHSQIISRWRPSKLFWISQNTNALYSPPLVDACMVRVCGRSRNRQCLAVGDDFACLPIAAVTTVVSIVVTAGRLCGSWPSDYWVVRLRQSHISSANVIFYFVSFLAEIFVEVNLEKTDYRQLSTTNNCSVANTHYPVQNLWRRWTTLPGCYLLCGWRRPPVAACLFPQVMWWVWAGWEPCVRCVNPVNDVHMENRLTWESRVIIVW